MPPSWPRSERSTCAVTGSSGASASTAMPGMGRRWITSERHARTKTGADGCRGGWSRIGADDFAGRTCGQREEPFMSEPLSEQDRIKLARAAEYVHRMTEEAHRANHERESLQKADDAILRAILDDRALPTLA